VSNIDLSNIALEVAHQVEDDHHGTDVVFEVQEAINVDPAPADTKGIISTLNLLSSVITIGGLVWSMVKYLWISYEKSMTMDDAIANAVVNFESQNIVSQNQARKIISLAASKIFRK